MDEPLQDPGPGEEPRKRRRIVRKPRPVVSCLSCRAKKLRCNRELPCQKCEESGRASSCSYTDAATSARRNAQGRHESFAAPHHTSAHLPVTGTSSQAQAPTPNSDVSSHHVVFNRMQSSESGAVPQESLYAARTRDAVPSLLNHATSMRVKGSRTRYLQNDYRRALVEKVRLLGRHRYI